MSQEYVRFEIVDMNGKALSKTVPARNKKTPVYIYSGACAMGANSEVLTFPEEVGSAGCPNWKLVPEWSTEAVLPWACRTLHGKPVTVSRVICEQDRTVTGSPESRPNLAVPRTVCRRLLDELRGFDGLGIEMLAACEYEFTLAKPREGDWVPFFDGVDIFATLQNNKAADFLYELEGKMEQAGIDIQTMNAEYGHGQLEVTFAPKFGIEAADAGSTFKTGVKEIAQAQGLRASFMTRPFTVNQVCNGGHFNFSLWAPSADAPKDEEALGGFSTDGRVNALHSTADASGLSATAKHFLAGVLSHGPAIEAFAAPTPPCYDRHGKWAPTCASWGVEDRNSAVRVKAHPSGSPRSCYMEYRMPSAASNPYLVIASLVAAGLDGLRNKLELPPPLQSIDGGAKPLPTTLEDALAALESDKYMVDALGHDLVRWFCQVKRAEIDWINKKGEDDASKFKAWQDMYMEFI
eukprot:CAMPEP_0117546600 /NCGR_PEP_ID=MMETSP0784-20121206/46688_1 /TAXON_ID=39447 /ORGANISM="" /LENGTH=463 /DNA_ID=CAMNT_0005343471 /DNA_START=72 /DNA_END=1463 /DNA_ORIENTATION=+